jgi:hypothetical protein
MRNAVRLLALATFVIAVAGCGGTADGPSSASSSPGGSATDVAARIGDHEITLNEVDLKVKQTDIKPFQALYDARKQALEALVADHLLETEASERGIEKEALMAQEVTAKVETPTAEQIQSFYDQRKNVMQGRTLEQVSGQIQSFLTTQSRQAAMNALLAGIKEKHPVKMSLEVPRVPVTVAANDPTKGPVGAPIQILEFSDFQ